MVMVMVMVMMIDWGQAAGCIKAVELVMQCSYGVVVPA